MFSEHDCFSITDAIVGLNVLGIQNKTFKFWIKGIKRILMKLHVSMQEIIYVEEFFNKIFSCI
jgi:hypothetical protein